jgi:hypothetical protein
MPLLSKLITIIFQLLASTISFSSMIKLFAYIIECFENYRHIPHKSYFLNITLSVLKLLSLASSFLNIHKPLNGIYFFEIF